MPINGETGDHDEDPTVSDTIGAHVRRLAGGLAVYARNLHAYGEIVDGLDDEDQAAEAAPFAREIGELGDQFHDLRRALSRIGRP